MIRKTLIVFLATAAILIAAGLLNALRYTQDYTDKANSLYEDPKVYAKYLHCKFPEFEVVFDYQKVAKLLVDQISDEMFIHGILYTKDPEVEWTIVPIEDVIREKITEMYVAPINAELCYDETHGYYLTHEVDSASFDVDSVVTAVLLAIDTGLTEIDCSRFMIQAEIYEKDLLADLQQVEWLNDFSYTFTNGMGVNGKDLVPYVTDDLELSVGVEEFDTLATLLSAYYATNGMSTQFHTSGDEYIDVKYCTYGTTFDKEETMSALMEHITNRESASNVEPVLHGYDSGMKTYVEISISDQHVWHYVDGELCCDSPCVTGTKGVHDTPHGVYYVSERITGKWLTGPGYRSWVDKWMRLTNSGVGLHDASWRGSFGGTIYTYNGSHGCINLPPKYAKALFDELRVGVPAVIY